MQPNTAAPPRQPKRILGVFGSFDGDQPPRTAHRPQGGHLRLCLRPYWNITVLTRSIFFCLISEVCPGLRQYYENGLSLERNQGKIRFFPGPSACRPPWSAMHTPPLHYPEHHRFVPELCHQRNRWAPGSLPPSPACPHSLNPWESHTRNLFKVLPGIMPYDSILCTSRAARSYLENSFASLAESLARLGAPKPGLRRAL